MRMRIQDALRRLSAIFAMTLSAIFMLPGTANAQGGPVVLMGIDAEDGGVGGHGPISIYQNVASSILNNVTKPGASGILVLGGVTGSQVPTWWSALAAGIGSGVPVTFVNGSAIQTVNFSSYALIGIASDEFNTSGGLTNAENGFLASRASDLAAHVNSGGGLLGFSNCALSNPYAYLGGLGAFACTSVGEADITPTAQGTTIGITDALDVCCWHDAYTTFPSFLQILATYPAAGGQTAAIGGVQVVIPGFILTPNSATNTVGTPHTVTIEVTQTISGQTSPVPGVTVNFTVNGANTATGSCVTAANGQCTFTYIGTNTGTDTITAAGTVGTQQQTATATKTWITPPHVEVPFDIRPTSCRNPLNVKVGENSAVIPAAILGTAQLDVSQIDLATVRLEGVKPLRSSIADVATPYVPYIGKSGATDCTTAGPDGYADLTLKFNAQQLVNAIGGPGAVTDGQVLVLKLTGLLLNGTPIIGEDVVVVLNKK